MLLVIAVALSGSSFGTIELANSNLFGIDLFSMGLSKRFMKEFQAKRCVLNTVLSLHCP